MTAASSEHNGWYIALVVFNFLALIAVFIFSGLSSQGLYPLFVSTTSAQADRYRLDIIPASWTFSTIWSIIYAWQAAWLLYSMIYLCRTNAQKDPLYSTPYVLPPIMLGFYSVANGLNVAWVVLFDRSHIEAAFAMLLLLSILLMVTMGIGYRALRDGHKDLIQQGRIMDIWLVRGLVHNGIGMYAAWTHIAALLNLAVVISYTTISDVSVTVASRVALAILAADVGLFAIVDFALLDRFARFVITPYCVVVIALAGVLTGTQWPPAEQKLGETNYTLAVVLCGVAALIVLVKIVVAVVRSFRDARSVSFARQGKANFYQNTNP